MQFRMKESPWRFLVVNFSIVNCTIIQFLIENVYYIKYTLPRFRGVSRNKTLFVILVILVFVEKYVFSSS